MEKKFLHSFKNKKIVEIYNVSYRTISRAIKK